MEYGQQMQEAHENAKLSFYQNPSYQFERREKKTLTLDVSSAVNSTMDENFNIQLLEPLRIDRLSDVYLDSFTTFNAKINTAKLGQNMGFTLTINEFNNNSNIASNQHKTAGSIDSTKFNTIFIPNSSSSTESSTVTHKAKKFNYIASINPCTISSLSGSILDAGTITGNAPTYSSPFKDTTGADPDEASRFIAEFIIVARD